MLDKML